MCFVLSFIIYLVTSQVGVVSRGSTVIMWLGFVATGILVAHAPYLPGLFKGDPVIDENPQKAFAVIEEADKRGLTKQEVKQMYIKLVQSYIEKVTLKPESESQIVGCHAEPQGGDS